MSKLIHFNKLSRYKILHLNLNYFPTNIIVHGFNLRENMQGLLLKIVFDLDPRLFVSICPLSNQSFKNTLNINFGFKSQSLIVARKRLLIVDSIGLMPMRESRSKAE